jgi:hypothetical protein
VSAPIRYSDATDHLVAARSLQGQPCAFDANRDISGQAGDLGGVSEQVQDGGPGHLKLLSRAVGEPPARQATTKVTDWKDGPHLLGAVLTRVAHLADKTSPFGCGHCIGSVFPSEID